MHNIIRFLFGTIIGAFAIGFECLADLIRDFLDFLRWLMRHLVTIPLQNVIALVVVGPEQDFPHHPFTPTHTSVGLDSSSSGLSNNSALVDLKLISHLHQSLTKILDERVNGANIGHQRIVSPNPLPPSPNYLSPPPAIPPHLKDCEFYYNNVDLDPVQDSPLFKSERPIVRITVDGLSQTCDPESAKIFLQNLDTLRKITVSNAGILDLGEEKRGKLEVKNRVYVGPAQWLLRVLMEEL